MLAALASVAQLAVRRPSLGLWRRERRALFADCCARRGSVKFFHFEWQKAADESAQHATGSCVTLVKAAHSVLTTTCDNSNCGPQSVIACSSTMARLRSAVGGKLDRSFDIIKSIPIRTRANFKTIKSNFCCEHSWSDFRSDVCRR